MKVEKGDITPSKIKARKDLHDKIRQFFPFGGTLGHSGASRRILLPHYVFSTTIFQKLQRTIKIHSGAGVGQS